MYNACIVYSSLLLLLYNTIHDPSQLQMYYYITHHTWLDAVQSLLVLTEFKIRNGQYMDNMHG